MIHAKQRTPTKQPKPVTPSKAAPNLKHHMASRKLEKDLKKRIADLQVHINLCSETPIVQQLSQKHWRMPQYSVSDTRYQDLLGIYRIPASSYGTSHTAPVCGKTVQALVVQEDLAASRAAVGSEKERSSALGESVRRAQQARREGEQERVRAASAADMVRQKVSGLAARVKALQRQLEEVCTPYRFVHLCPQEMVHCWVSDCFFTLNESHTNIRKKSLLFQPEL